MSMAWARVIDVLIEAFNSWWKASNQSPSAAFRGWSSSPSMRWTRRAKIAATSRAQVSQYFRSPHLSTIFA